METLKLMKVLYVLFSGTCLLPLNTGFITGSGGSRIEDMFAMKYLTEKVDNNRWRRFTGFTTTNGYPCLSSCEKRVGSSHYSCSLKEKGAWGHCSPTAYTDYNGANCTRECRYHGRFWGYYWCHTDANMDSWNYCGITFPKSENGTLNYKTTRYGDPCVSNCEKSDGTKYNWCSTPGGSWEKCSTNDGYDVDGKKCKSSCGYRGKRYMWCWLEKGGWNYCSLRVSKGVQ